MFLTKSDRLSGNVLGIKNKTPPVFNRITIETHLMKRVVGTKEEIEIEDIKMNEVVMINAWTAKTLGVISSIQKDKMVVNLKLPICTREGERIAISKRVNNRWRLIGWGKIVG